MLRFTLVILFLLSTFAGKAVDDFKDDATYFKKHLLKNRYDLDTSANAIVLYERVTFSLVAKTTGAQRVQTVRKVIKILNKKGIDYADVLVPIVAPGGRYDFRNIKAKTYNLVNGDVSATSVNKKDVMTDNVHKVIYLEKFSLPNVVAGSIVDYSYELQTGFSSQLGDWDFQEEIPKLYSEVVGNYPATFQVAIMSKTNNPFKEISGDEPRSGWTDTYVKTGKGFSSVYTSKIWVRENVSAAISEPHNYNVRNYTEKIQLQAVGTNQFTVTSYYLFRWAFDVSTWQGLNERLYEDLYGPKQFSFHHDKVKEERKEQNYNGPLQKKLLQLKGGNKDKMVTARRIFSFVRDSFIVDDYMSGWERDDIPDAFANRRGSKSEVIQILQRMLSLAGFQSNIVLVGTRNALRMVKDIPIFNRIDHTVCRVKVDGSVYFLDPSERYYGFGILKPDCYNGFAWAIDSLGYGVILDPATPLERTLVAVKTENNDINNYTLSVKRIFGHLSGAEMRGEWIRDTMLIKKKVQEELNAFPFRSELQNFEVANLRNADTTLQLTYTFKVNWPADPSLIFTPSLYNYYKENPFKMSKRYFPVELPYSVDMNYILSLALPQGYQVENLPQSIIYKLDDDNIYRYAIGFKAETNTLTSSTKLRMTRTYFDVVEYDQLKTFFDRIVEQQQKPCILKKI